MSIASLGGNLLPSTPLEIFGALWQGSAVLGMLFLLFQKAIGAKTRTLDRWALLVVVSNLCFQIPCFVMTYYYSDRVTPILYAWSNISSCVASFAYALFQVSVFHKFQPFTGMRPVWIKIMYIMVVGLFFGFQTPVLLGYTTDFVDPTSLMGKWLQFATIWWGYSILLDLRILTILYHAFLVVSPLQEHQPNNYAKWKLIFLMCFIFGFDILGVFGILFGLKTAVDEASFRQDRAWQLIATGSLGFHCILGLSFLNMIASSLGMRSKPDQSTSVAENDDPKNIGVSFTLPTRLYNSQAVKGKDNLGE